MPTLADIIGPRPRYRRRYHGNPWRMQLLVWHRCAREQPGLPADGSRTSAGSRPRSHSRTSSARKPTVRGKRPGSLRSTVTVCFVGTDDIDVWMIRQGCALAYHKYSAAYVREEDHARCQARLVARRVQCVLRTGAAPSSDARHRRAGKILRRLPDLSMNLEANDAHPDARCCQPV